MKGESGASNFTQPRRRPCESASRATHERHGIAVFLAGLGLASVFPIVIALMAKGFGARASRFAGWMFAAAGLGGATLPWLVGVLSERFGSLRAGLTVPLVGCVAMGALLVVIIRALPPSPTRTWAGLRG